MGTKFTVDLTQTPPKNDNRPERVKAACEGSLRRLKTDVIDLYHQHRIDRSVPIEDVAGAVADLIKAGKVRRFGLSEVSAETIRRAHRVCPVTSVQSEYHLMFRKPETEVFATMQDLGISLVAYSPLNRGFLGGTLTEYADMNTNDIRGDWPRFTSNALRANTRIVDVLNEFGKTRGMTSSQVALAWMLSKHPFIVPLFGTTKLSHLEEDLRGADFTLTGDEITDLEAKVSRFPVVGERYDAVQQARVEYLIGTGSESAPRGNPLTRRSLESREEGYRQRPSRARRARGVHAPITGQRCTADGLRSSLGATTPISRPWN